MEYSGFLPVTWINEEVDESADETEKIYLKVTIWKTLLVCAIDFLVVMGEIFILYVYEFNYAQPFKNFRGLYRRLTPLTLQS
jgi:hypothetical protein